MEEGNGKEEKERVDVQEAIVVAFLHTCILVATPQDRPLSAQTGLPRPLSVYATSRVVTGTPVGVTHSGVDGEGSRPGGRTTRGRRPSEGLAEDLIRFRLE